MFVPVSSCLDLTLPVNQYKVTIQSTEASRRCQLAGEYLVSLGKQAVMLLAIGTGHVIYRWPYTLIRKFGQCKVRCFKKKKMERIHKLNQSASPCIWNMKPPTSGNRGNKMCLYHLSGRDCRVDSALKQVVAVSRMKECSSSCPRKVPWSSRLYQSGALRRRGPWTNQSVSSLSSHRWTTEPQPAQRTSLPAIILLLIIPI